eukprot:363256-Chlamydomonas_euryale.AAC.5
MHVEGPGPAPTPRCSHPPRTGRRGLACLAGRHFARRHSVPGQAPPFALPLVSRPTKPPPTMLAGEPRCDIISACATPSISPTSARVHVTAVSPSRAFCSPPACRGVHPPLVPRTWRHALACRDPSPTRHRTRTHARARLRAIASSS